MIILLSKFICCTICIEKIFSKASFNSFPDAEVAEDKAMTTQVPSKMFLVTVI